MTRSIATREVGRQTREYLELIKISHTVFALPFAIGTTFLAAGGWPRLDVLGKVVLAVVLARAASMAFNRWADQRFDAANPRTAERALPAGRLNPKFVLGSSLIALAAFFAVAAWINPLALRLSPFVALVLFGYSFTKRFTSLCHAILGLALGLAPVGAWVAVRGSLAGEPLTLGLAVLFWTAGFDVIYACLDVEFDRQAGLFSLPARIGVAGALRLAAGFHAAMLGVLAGLWWQSDDLGAVFLTAMGLVAALLVYEHRLVRADDLTRVNQAFFTTNGVISAVLMIALITDAFVD
ncbi:MAG: UbiA-like polyprenyltransferase [Planctomycetota bacterium]